MYFSKIRYTDNWLGLGEALDLLFTASGKDKAGMNEYYRMLNEIQFYVNTVEIELEETKLQLHKYQEAFNKCLIDKQNVLQTQEKKVNPIINIK